MKPFPKLSDIALVALDLDGTVICPQGKQPVSARTKQAIRAVAETGTLVTFVTGRTENYALPLALEFGLTTPLVTYNGTRLYCPVVDRILHQSSIEPEIARSLTDWLHETDEVVACYLTRTGQNELLQSRCSGNPAHDDYLFGTPRTIISLLSQAIADEGDSVDKLIVSTQRPLSAEVGERFGPVVSVVRTHPELVEILPAGVSKGSGVKRLCEYLGISPNQVFAVGDQENDIATFQVSGYSVAMGDAPEKVRKAADSVTGTFEQDGCAMALEKLLQN